MFTGLVCDVGDILRIEDRGGIRYGRIRTGLDVSAMKIGASIACDGCCLTVVDKEAVWFGVEMSNETLAKTTLGTWQEGTKVNLEQSLKLGDEIGGHMVSGHVDGVAILEKIMPDGEAYRLYFQVPEILERYIAPKGSVALNGISLTVNEVEGNRFVVCIIPHTWEVTNIGLCKPEDKINLEIDILARYVARMLGK
ncbi:MAG: riboflavin synthase [Alphaproteobacteria bacterium CG_4_9_14_3_um_filter_47_13]|nr:MAG: riboflavin synthase [Alphaproteobacteria bacterium CG_4_9_14_3_um_filter_47_13]